MVPLAPAAGVLPAPHEETRGLALTPSLAKVYEALVARAADFSFEGIVAASGSGFVRELGAFHDATHTHLSYIRRRIPEIEPRLEEDCRVLDAGIV